MAMPRANTREIPFVGVAREHNYDESLTMSANCLQLYMCQLKMFILSGVSNHLIVAPLATGASQHVKAKKALFNPGIFRKNITIEPPPPPPPPPGQF